MLSFRHGPRLRGARHNTGAHVGPPSAQEPHARLDGGVPPRRAHADGEHAARVVHRPELGLRLGRAHARAAGAARPVLRAVDPRPRGHGRGLAARAALQRRGRAVRRRAAPARRRHRRARGGVAARARRAVRVPPPRRRPRARQGRDRRTRLRVRRGRRPLVHPCARAQARRAHLPLRVGRRRDHLRLRHARPPDCAVVVLPRRLARGPRDNLPVVQLLLRHAARVPHEGGAHGGRARHRDALPVPGR
mmetsp:Transcript_32586/g.112717  ORF Transcript_32586/g.112717 Transcript_32586/m.112717 type:complete len:248 (+) Transcript_32586:665-1408(+)